MNKIPTAEELIKKWQKSMLTKDGVNASNIMQREKLLADAIVEKCKLHVEAALKAAAKKVKTINSYQRPFLPATQKVDKDSILNAYPLNNIV